MCEIRTIGVTDRVRGDKPMCNGRLNLCKSTMLIWCSRIPDERAHGNINKAFSLRPPLSLRTI